MWAAVVAEPRVRPPTGKGVARRTRTGTPWRHLPERYGPWRRVHNLFRRRQRDGPPPRSPEAGVCRGHDRGWWVRWVTGAGRVPGRGGRRSRGFRRRAARNMSSRSQLGKDCRRKLYSILLIRRAVDYTCRRPGRSYVTVRIRGEVIGRTSDPMCTAPNPGHTQHNPASTDPRCRALRRRRVLRGDRLTA
ncbi:transposase [Streptomyces varsoviensis]|uniref:transposase n=1 Tax=Streptomyces varsoviensis TaxID=67373 RepID=UPI003F4CAFD2